MIGIGSLFQGLGTQNPLIELDKTSGTSGVALALQSSGAEICVVLCEPYTEKLDMVPCIN